MLDYIVNKINEVYTDSKSIISSIENIATDHTSVIQLFIIVVVILIATITALAFAYRWGRMSQNQLRVEKINYKKNFYFLQSILKAIPDEIFRINKNGDIIPTIELPEEVERQTKDYTYIGVNIFQLWDYIFAQKISETIKEVVESKTPCCFDYDYMHNDTLKWYNIQMVPFGNSEILATIRDITEKYNTKFKLAESEFLFQTQFEYGLNGVGILDETLNWITVNKRLGEILGYTTNELLALKWNQISIPEEKDYDSYLFAKNRAKTGLILESERRFLNKDGELIYVYCTIIQYYNNNSNSKSFIVTFQDISFRKEHERTVLNAVIKTEEKERTNFAQEIHDGVGPILSSIKMYLQWMQRPDNKVDKTQIIQDCENLIDDAHRTIREVSFNLSPHVLKNFGLIASLQAFTARLKEASKINIDFQVTNDKVRFPESVELVLYRAVTECINNTIKYANAKNITITINNSDKNMELFYCDDGIGFNAEEVLASAKGTGLYNIKNRVRSVNGECYFLGKLGSGTQILFNINL